MGVEEKQMNAQITTAAKAAGTGNAGMQNIDFGSLDIYGKRKRRRIALALLAIVIIVAAAVELEGVLHRALTPNAFGIPDGKAVPASEAVNTLTSAFFYNPINVTYTGTVNYTEKAGLGPAEDSVSIPVSATFESESNQYKIFITSDSLYFSRGESPTPIPLTITIAGGANGTYFCSSGSYSIACMNNSVFDIALLNNLSGIGTVELVRNISSFYKGINLTIYSSVASSYNGTPCTQINGTVTGVPGIIKARYVGAQVHGYGSFNFCLSKSNRLPLKADFGIAVSVYNESNTGLVNTSITPVPPPSTEIFINISFDGHFGREPAGNISVLTEPLANFSSVFPSGCSAFFGAFGVNSSPSCSEISLNSTGNLGFYLSQKRYAKLELTGISCVLGTSAPNSSDLSYSPEAVNLSAGTEGYITAVCPLYGNPPYFYAIYAEYNANGNLDKGPLVALYTYKTTAKKI